MNFSCHADSQFYFQPTQELSVDPKLFRFRSIRGRLLCLGTLFEKLLILPFALFFKALKTFFRAIGVLFGAALLLATLATSDSIRELFFRRVSSLSKDLADWILLPFAAVTCIARLLLGSSVHPRLYFGF